MKFINKSEDRKVRQPNKKGYVWKTVKTGETIKLPEKLGLSYGFEPVKAEKPEDKKVTEGKVSDKKVETKQFEDSEEKESDK